MEIKRIANLDNIMLAFIPMIVLFNIIVGILNINPIKVKEETLGLMSGLFFILIYKTYKHNMERKNKALTHKILDKDEKIINEITISSIFDNVFIFICGFVTSKATLLTIGYTYNNMEHLNSSFAPFLLILLTVFTPIPIFFFTNADIYITNKHIRVIWNNFFIKSLFRVKNSKYTHNDIRTIKRMGLVFKKIVIEYNNGCKYEINNIVVRNYKKIESALNEIAR